MSMTLDEFFAEAKRLNLKACDLVPGLTMRPEFDDCLSKDFKEAKATIMAMPEQELRSLAIAQHIQLRFHEKYGNAMSNANAALREEQADAGVAPCERVQMPDKARAGIEALHVAVEQLLTTGRYVDEEGEATQALTDLLSCIANPPFKLAGNAGVPVADVPQEFFCNKCGYFGPVEVFHERPNDSGKCDYMAVPMKPASGVAIPQTRKDTK